MTISLGLLALLLLVMFYLGYYIKYAEYQQIIRKQNYENNRLLLQNLWLQDRLDYTEDKEWYNDFVEWSNK